MSPISAREAEMGDSSCLPFLPGKQKWETQAAVSKQVRGTKPAGRLQPCLSRERAAVLILIRTRPEGAEGTEARKEGFPSCPHEPNMGIHPPDPRQELTLPREIWPSQAV